MSKGQSVEINLLGQKIALRAEADPDLVQEVVELVTARLNEAESRAKGQVPHLVALLALFDLAEEYVRSKRRVMRHNELFQQRSDELSNLLDAELK